MAELGSEGWDGAMGRYRAGMNGVEETERVSYETRDIDVLDGRIGRWLSG